MIIQDDTYIYIYESLMNFIDPDPDNSFQRLNLNNWPWNIYVYIFLIHEINRYFSNIFETVYTAGARRPAREWLAQTKT